MQTDGCGMQTHINPRLPTTTSAIAHIAVPFKSRIATSRGVKDWLLPKNCQKSLDEGLLLRPNLSDEAPDVGVGVPVAVYTPVSGTEVVDEALAPFALVGVAELVG